MAVSDIETLKSIARVNEVSEKYILDRIPGKYTFILNRLSWISDQVGDDDRNVENDRSKISDFCIQNGTVGIRVPDSTLILDITKASGGIIAQTSANISGMPNCFSIDDIKNQYNDEDLREVDLIVDGGTLENSGPSKLVDLTCDVPFEIKRT